MRIRQCTFHGHGAPTANSGDLVTLLAGPSSPTSNAMGALARTETDGSVVPATGCDPQHNQVADSTRLTAGDDPMFPLLEANLHLGLSQLVVEKAVVYS